MGPLGLGNATFDSDMVNLTIIVPVLPFGFEIPVSTSGASQNGVMSGKISSCCEGFGLVAGVEVEVDLSHFLLGCCWYCLVLGL
jgi:hypothetical protein